MKKILQTSEIVGTCTYMGRECEICATGEAVFDEEDGLLTMELDRFVRPVGDIAEEDRLSPSWLPARQIVKERVELREGLPLAREIFHRWIGKIRPWAKSTINL